MQVRSRRCLPFLRSLVRSVVCPLLWLAEATLDCLYQLVVCTVWLVVSAARALLALALEAVRVAGWLAYYAVRTPLSAVLQCATALFWLSRLVMDAICCSLFSVVLIALTASRYVGVCLVRNVLRLCRALLT